MARKYKIDFGGVDQEIRKSGRAAHVPEGDYLVKITKGELRTSENTGGKYFNWQLQIVKPDKFKGKTLYTRTSLKPEALWNLRNLIHAVTGRNVAGKAVSFDPEALYGKVIAVTVEDDEYEGKIRSNVVDTRSKDDFNLSGEDEGEDEGEEEEEEEDEEDLEDVDVDEI